MTKAFNLLLVINLIFTFLCLFKEKFNKADVDNPGQYPSVNFRF